MSNTNLITMDKQYKTREGHPVRILAVDIKNDKFPVAGAISDPDGGESFEAFTASGRFFSQEGDTSRKDLFEVSPYGHIKVGDTVIYKDVHDSAWQVGYFAGTYNGKPKACSDHKTALEGEDIWSWDHCKKITIHENS
jgi:hypothetical protein